MGELLFAGITCGAVVETVVVIGGVKPVLSLNTYFSSVFDELQDVNTIIPKDTTISLTDIKGYLFYKNNQL